MPTIDGLASGLDTTTIIDSLVAIQQSQINQLTARKNTINAQRTAFKGIEAKLLELRTQMRQIGRPQSSVFESRTATTSDENALSATASTGSALGVYTLKIDKLAKAHQIASQGFESEDAQISQGTFTVRAGTGAAVSIAIDGTNNTLRGLADAINATEGDVSASIINDGSGGATPYRLLLTSNKTGAANSITVTNNLAAGAGGAVKPLFVASDSAIGAATPTSYSGTATATSNEGPGGYSGTDNDTYTFTVVSGGTVGTDDGIQISYTDGSGHNTGTLTINAADVDTLVDVAEGVKVKFSAGTLVTSDEFTIDVTAAVASDPVQEASDAVVTLGSGAGAITVSNQTNQLDKLITGVTLDLKAADSTKSLTVTIGRNTQSAVDAVTGFVDSFNGLMDFIDEQVRFDPETNAANILQGSRSAVGIQDDIRRLAISVVGGVNTDLNRLSAIGVSVSDQGRLGLDSQRLTDALTGKIAGVTEKDVQRLFGLDGKSNNAGVQYIQGTSKTKESTTPVQIDITQAAERATIRATNALSASTVIDSTNNTLKLTLNGATAANLTLTEGTYTRQQLADHLESVINSSESLKGRSVAVSVEDDAIRITSNSFGSNSEVSVGTSTALSALGFAGTETDRGLDVQGKFLVDGVEETATGSGRILTGSSSNANTSGLQLRITLTSGQLQDGADAEITVSRGIASKLEQFLDGILDTSTGRLKAINDGFDQQVDAIDDTIDKRNALIDSKREALLRQFAAMERAVSQLQSTGNYLAAQLTSLLGANSAR